MIQFDWRHQTSHHDASPSDSGAPDVPALKPADDSPGDLVSLPSPVIICASRANEVDAWSLSRLPLDPESTATPPNLRVLASKKPPIVIPFEASPWPEAG
jgi:hypothetical protein